MSKEVQKNRELSRWTIPLCAAGGALYFLAVGLSAPPTMKATAMVLALIALGGCFIAFSELRARITPPLLMLLLILLMDGISCFYAPSGKFALSEFLKVLISFCAILILWAFVPGKGETLQRRVGAILAVCTALMGLVSIDLLSTRLISNAVLGLLNLLGAGYQELSGVEPGVRMLSMLDAPNVFAGCAGLGTLLSLGLANEKEKGGERRFFLTLLFTNALSFVLAFSMGASGAVAVAFAVYLLLEPAERRATLLTLMLETLVLTVAAAALISATSFGAWDSPRPVPLLCLIAGSAALVLLDRVIKKLPDGLFLKHRRAVPVLIAAAAVLCALFALAAWDLTGPVSLPNGGALRRAAYPPPGEYALRFETDAPLHVRAVSQNRQEAMMHTETVLYDGGAENAKISVPEDSLVVYFDIRAEADARILSADYVGEGGDGSIPLRYLLLPGFIANRIQGLWENQNAIQRAVFFSDGLKLFRRSPIVGLGMGAYENGLMSVQSFYYETKYAHNHYIQALVETGAVGLALFLGLLAVSARSVRRGKRTDPLVPALGACLVFMAIHAAVEVVFSFYAYLPVAFGVFALCGMCSAPAPQREDAAKKVQTGGLLGAAALILTFAALLGLNLAAEHELALSQTYDALDRAIRLDRYEWADYMLTYVSSAEAEGTDPEIRAKADAYALRLSRVNSNTIPLYLAEYYFRTDRTEEGLRMLEKYVSYVPANPAAWEQTFSLLEQYEEDSDVYRDGVRRVASLLEQWNAEHMGKISLSDGAQALVAAVGTT